MLRRDQQGRSLEPKDVAVAIAQWPKVNKRRPRISIITQGKDPILVAIA